MTMKVEQQRKPKKTYAHLPVEHECHGKVIMNRHKYGFRSVTDYINALIQQDEELRRQQKQKEGC